MNVFVKIKTIGHLNLHEFRLFWPITMTTCYFNGMGMENNRRFLLPVTPKLVHHWTVQHPTCRILTCLFDRQSSGDWQDTQITVSQQYRDFSLQLLRHDTDTESRQTYKRLYFNSPASTHTTSGFSIMTFFIDLLQSKIQVAVSERFGINKAGSGIILHLQTGVLLIQIYINKVRRNNLLQITTFQHSTHCFIS